MSFKPSKYPDCCLLTDIDLNSERIYHLLERRFKSNANQTSFDFKSFRPEQPSDNAKVSRSLLRCQPKIQFLTDYDENFSSDSSTSEEEDNDDEVLSTNDDDYLNKLAEWEPENFQPTTETDDDEDEENIFEVISPANTPEDNEPTPMEHSPGSIIRKSTFLLMCLIFPSKRISERRSSGYIYPPTYKI